MEDIISRNCYHSAVQNAYPTKPVDPPPEHHAGKRTKYYEQYFKEKLGIGFNKRRVGEQLKIMLINSNVDASTREALTKVTNAIVGALDEQLGGGRSQKAKSIEISQQGTIAQEFRSRPDNNFSSEISPRDGISPESR